MKRAKVICLMSAVLSLGQFGMAPYAMAAESSSPTHTNVSSINHSLPDAITDILTIKDVKVFGSGEKTTWKLLSTGKELTYIVVVGKNDDIIAGLNRFIQSTKIKGARFTALGAVGCAALGFYRPEDHIYKITKIKQAEVASLVGNIGMKNGRPVVHAHGVFSLEDGTCVGGHVFYASVWPTAEITVTETETAPVRHADEESGLWLYDTSADSN